MARGVFTVAGFNSEMQPLMKQIALSLFVIATASAYAWDHTGKVAGPAPAAAVVTPAPQPSDPAQQGVRLKPPGPPPLQMLWVW